MQQDFAPLVQALNDAAANDPDRVSDEALAEVMTAVVRLFGAKCEERFPLPEIIHPDALTATAAATVASELIRAVDMNLFDFAMWHDRVR
ncbi:MAG: hypothetical protein QM607_01615 [Microbacterium sp.]